MSLLKQVITSWQVIAVTIAVVIYISIVSYAARTHRRSPSLVPKKTKTKKKKAQPASEGPEVSSGSNTNDELGLEEA